MIGLKFLLAFISLMLAATQFGTMISVYWVLVCFYWTVNALDERKENND